LNQLMVPNKTLHPYRLLFLLCFCSCYLDLTLVCESVINLLVKRFA
jgi:hypothetical protein